MQIKYDYAARKRADADAIYIQLRQGEIDDTLNMGKYIHVDVDEEGRPLGLEILFAKHTLDVAQEERRWLQAPGGQEIRSLPGQLELT